MSQPPSLFHRSIAHTLSSWTALATCVRVGSGGRDSAAKAEWLVDATEQWMTENQGVEPEELAEMFKDILWEEFDTLVDDGSLLPVAKLIVDYQIKIKRGLKSEVEAAIKDAPKQNSNISIAANVNNDEDDESDADDAPGVAGGSGVDTGACTSHSGVSTEKDDADTAEEMEVDGDAAEEDDGWTTVKKGGKKKNK